MILGVMQPYFFPYIGYFQLIKHVDRMIFYDDVTYIKNGWIDRNRILINGSPHYFKVPLDAASSYRRICDIGLNSKCFEMWRSKFLRQLQSTYGSAPFYSIGMDLVEDVLFTECNSIGELAMLSVKKVTNYLKIQTIFLQSSVDYDNSELNRSERIIDFCKIEGCNTYVNNYSGFDLYNVEYFSSEDVSLNFLKPFIKEYSQRNRNVFVGGLSILDLIMNIDSDDIINEQFKYTIV